MPYTSEHDEIPNPLRPGLRAESIPEPCAAVIFGATGDLAHRKLVPALYNLALTGHLPAAFGIVGMAKSELAQHDFVRGMRESVGKFSRTKPTSWSSVRPLVVVPLVLTQMLSGSGWPMA